VCGCGGGSSDGFGEDRFRVAGDGVRRDRGSVSENTSVASVVWPPRVLGGVPGCGGPCLGASIGGVCGVGSRVVGDEVSVVVPLLSGSSTVDRDGSLPAGWINIKCCSVCTSTSCCGVSGDF
jgi:hypothetical protein